MKRKDNNREVVQPVSFLPQLPEYIYSSNCVEFWREINPLYVPGLNGRYLVSTFGRIMDTKFGMIDSEGRIICGKIMPGSFDSKGYLKVTLLGENNERFTRKIHRLEMMTFYYFPGCENYEVNHKDGNHINNFSWNLEWATGAENRHHSVFTRLEPTIFGSPIAILTNEQVWKIRELCIARKMGAINMSNNQMIKYLGLQDIPGISRRTIERIEYEETPIYAPYWYTDARVPRTVKKATNYINEYNNRNL